MKKSIAEQLAAINKVMGCKSSVQDEVMPWGQFKGVSLHELALSERSYLEWAYRQEGCMQSLQNKIKAALMATEKR